MSLYFLAKIFCSSDNSPQEDDRSSRQEAQKRAEDRERNAPSQHSHGGRYGGGRGGDNHERRQAQQELAKANNSLATTTDEWASCWRDSLKRYEEYGAARRGLATARGCSVNWELMAYLVHCGVLDGDLVG